MRGTFIDSGAFTAYKRFIPALAGNICFNCGIIFMPTVHPRACGEHCLCQLPIKFRNGSSPRLRGTSFLLTASLLPRRFIPALAGNILSDNQSINPTTVHPRACGEHFVNGFWVCVWHGSSPRLRGTLCCMTDFIAFFRFIPALAGNICSPLSRLILVSVHPRACGEHIYSIIAQ